MDPALQELIEDDSGEELEVLVKTNNFQEISDDLKIISRLGNIATARIKRENIQKVWKKVECLKAPRFILIDPSEITSSVESESGQDPNADDRENLEEYYPQINSNKTVIAVLDWGFDFTHPHLRFPDGGTKFIAIWDQGAPFDGQNRFGYGRIVTRAEINKALETEAPFEEVGYHPDSKGYFPSGTHGTHVTGIASQMAPALDLIGVHLATGKIKGIGSLGDSVRIVEAIDFVMQKAGDRPCCINMSVGSMGGSHTGTSLVEQAIDTALTSRTGLAICQSAGNYYRSKTHAHGFVTQNQSRKLEWVVGEADRTPNELEIWYNSVDDFKVRLTSPEKDEEFEVHFEGESTLTDGEKDINRISKKVDINLKGFGRIGRMYLRKNDSTTGLNHIDIFLYPNAPSGTWEVELVGKTVYSGEFHAWIERDGSCRSCQSNFGESDISPFNTTGTIANSRFGIAVGAYQDGDSGRSIAPFSSAGRVLDHNRRVKPELLAPGVDISAAKSASKRELKVSGMPLTSKSGTSMAAPHVTGALALLFESLPEQLSIFEIRQLLFASTDIYESKDEPPERYGHGILNLNKLIKMGLEYDNHMKKGVHSKEVINICSVCKGKVESPVLGSSISATSEESKFGLEEISEEQTKDRWIDHVVESLEELPGGNETLLAELLTESFGSEDAPFIESSVLSQIGKIFQTGGLSLLSSFFELIAPPGGRFQAPLQKGDILIRLGPEGQLGQSLILDTTISSFADDQLLPVESNLPGYYIEVLDKDAHKRFSPIYRRLTNHKGFLPLRQMVIRLKNEDSPLVSPPQEDEASDPIPADDLTWPGASDVQLAFMRRVYTRNLNRSRKRGKFYPDISQDDLEVIEGRFKAKSEAAKACRKMLKDARRAIAQEKVNVRIGLTSGYRSATHQFRLWNRYFRQRYYPETRARRRRFRGGQHGVFAAGYMARYIRRRIATPGFSNHNKGIAVDLLNKQDGEYIRNRSRRIHLRKWKDSWFWKWLLANAERYGFYQNPRINEPWHWEYYGTSQSSESAVHLAKSRAYARSESKYYSSVPLDPGTGGRSIDVEALQVGDIILSTTREWISGAIREMTSSPVSHTILYIGDGQVVEAVRKGVVLNSLADALKKGSLAVAFRYPDLSFDKALQIRDFVGQQIGKSYDYWGIVKQAGFQIDKKAICSKINNSRERAGCTNWAGQINLGTDSNDRFFCSELVLEAYRHVGLPLTTTPPHWNSPDDIAKLVLNTRLGYVGHLLG